MNSYTVNYNVVGAGTHKFYCGSTVYASISSTATTFNNSVNCGSNTVSCSGVNINSTSYGNAPLKVLMLSVNLATNASSQDYMYIGFDTYGGGFGGVYNKVWVDLQL